MYPHDDYNPDEATQMRETTLPAAEAAALAEHEAVIDRGIKTYCEVGAALADIRDRRLYRAEHDTFEQYTEQRWQMSRSRAYQMIEAAEVVSTIVDTGAPIPANEGQARELSRVPGPERAEVWAATVERTEGRPTAAAIRDTHQLRQQPDADPLTDADLPADADWAPRPQVVSEPKGRRRSPLPEAFAGAVLDLTRAAERLERLADDDRFARNRDVTQVPELIGALERTTHFVEALDLPGAEASEEARRWWATCLLSISDALAGVARSIGEER